MKGAYVYILSNKRNGTLYVGVTSNLVKRIFEHKEKVVNGFSAKYNLDLLVYYEERGSIEEAIQREKQLKAGNRKKKLGLIESINPDWKDLSEYLE
ncbi:GIY-YIG nuclease family protein [Candidatus Gracilibacteria bacterium]|nr:MAG: GIY-YIG nuclease family protein [Candidatus Gracilibacteria bacterium]